jgi:hypothetical protein
MKSLKNKTNVQNSISKIEIFVLEFFPYFEIAYKTMTSLATSPTTNRAIVISPN